jgi:hypothetical protein
MITADKLKLLTTLTPTALTQFLQSSGYKQDRVTECKFLGITNGGQFCYHVTYKTDERETDSCKVFLTYDPTKGQVIASY